MTQNNFEDMYLSIPVDLTPLMNDKTREQPQLENEEDVRDFRSRIIDELESKLSDNEEYITFESFVEEIFTEEVANWNKEKDTD